MNSHRNAGSTSTGRLPIVRRLEAGEPVAQDLRLSLGMKKLGGATRLAYAALSPD